MHSYEPHFRRWEPHLQQIVSRYPDASKIYCSGASPSTVRQALQQSLKFYCQNPYITSVIPHDQACLVDRTFVFGSDPDGTIYIGPRRSRIQRSAVSVASESTPPPPIPPIDCSNPITLTAILHLKNFNLLPIPLLLTNLTPTPDIPDNYPNIELIPNPDGSFTIL